MSALEVFGRLSARALAPSVGAFAVAALLARREGFTCVAGCDLAAEAPGGSVGVERPECSFLGFLFSGGGGTWSRPYPSNQSSGMSGPPVDDLLEGAGGKKICLPSESFVRNPERRDPLTGK